MNYFFKYPVLSVQFILLTKYVHIFCVLHYTLAYHGLTKFTCKKHKDTDEQVSYCGVNPCNKCASEKKLN